jgi:hypothetical protein
MGNTCELQINPVSPKWRKALKRHAKRQAARKQRLTLAASPLVARPGKSESLKEVLKVDSTAPVKPVGSHRRHDAQYPGGIPRAIEDDGPAGIGWQRKRMPCCNGKDRAVARAAEIPNPKGCRLLPDHN